MRMEKRKLLRAGKEDYTNKDFKDFKDNPLLCIEAIGYLKACKIVMPEDTELIDEMIDGYMQVFLLLALSQ